MDKKQKFLHWFVGETVGNFLLNSWDKFTGKTIQTEEEEISVDKAKESLTSMEESIKKLTAALSTVMASHEITKKKYEAKLKEFNQYEGQAIFAQSQGNSEAAYVAMNKAILIEEILPQLEERVKDSVKIVEATKDKLNREKQKLANYKIHLQNLKDLEEVNAAMTEISQTNSQLSLDSSQLEKLYDEVQYQREKLKVQAELSEGYTEKLDSDFEAISRDEEINRRLKILAEKHLHNSVQENN